MKKLLFCFLPVLILFLSGCAPIWKDIAPIPDERAGPNLVVYFAEDGNTRRAARAVAQASGGGLFDISGKKPLPDPLDYDTFFVGGPAAEGRIAAALENFLARTDFMDGRVIPFWTVREEADLGPAGDLNGEFEKTVRGGRLLRGRGFLFAGRIKAKDIREMAGNWTETVLAELGLRRAAGGDQAEDMAKLFAVAYSGRLGPAIFQDGDWTFEMDGVRWYYAQGRFLPQEDMERAEEFRPQFLYRYSPEPRGNPDEVSPWRHTANQILSRRQSPASPMPYRLYSNPDAIRSPLFETIWQARSKEEAFLHQRWIRFLGRLVQVHEDIVFPLGRVEARIQGLAENDGEIRQWIGDLQSITGWNWRNVAGSTSRSFHAYGAAVDLLMKVQPGMETYWRWTAAKGIDWRSVPAEKRQNPPAAAIRAFEDQGFIWGGRWGRYDTMHFEYHPELLILGTGSARQ
ncbi:MAG: M15 family metallopeptidase [Spirochaetaceae bacterium]|nr:M15 family metallopeptidase [Spirochaetaceae bacterium]